MPRTNPEARAWTATYLRSHPSATWNEANSAAAAAGVKMSINSFYRWRNELQRVGVGTAGEDGADPVASTATVRRAASATARTPLTADPLVATLRTELQRTAKMRAALGEIRSILRETL